MFLEIQTDPHKGRKEEEWDAVFTVIGRGRKALKKELREEPEREEGLGQVARSQSASGDLSAE